MSPRDKAERCFALARSTTFEGERANAIAQGERIAAAANLSLDLFDIPGRKRAARRASPLNMVHFEGPLTPEMAAAINDAIARYAATNEAARFAAMRAAAAGAASYRPPRERCPHGSSRALFGDSCELCARERATR